MRRRRRQGARLILLAAAGALACAVAIVAWEIDALRPLDLDSVDERFEIRGERPPPADLVVVSIDDVSFDELRTQWPFPRSMHGRVIDRLRRDGAKAIAYDVQFTEPTEVEEDEALYQAVARAGNVVLGTTEVDERGRTNILGGDENLRAADAAPGSAQYVLDPGGVIRRLPYSTDKLKSFAVVAAERAYGRPVDREGFGGDGAWIDFHGGPGAVKTIPFSRVLDGKFEPGTFGGKVVVVGASAPSLQDVHATSTSGRELMSGPEIQAHAISTVRRGLPLDDGPVWLDVALIALLAMVAPLASLRLSGLWTLAAALGALGIFLVGAQLAFNEGMIVSVVYPAAAALLSAVACLAIHYFTEVRERQRTRAAFSRFVPEPVVDRVLEQTEDGLRLGGEEMLGTVLFSDLRGFTTFSENVPAERVIEILNRYLTEMTDVILAHGGTLVSYMGDGIMAVFGAPIEQEDHADRALGAGCEMVGSRLDRFNEWARREAGVEQEFKMGVGLNSGLFMAGNVGSARRLEYTVIGDTTNTAARLEGMTKGTPYSLFMAESTRFMLLRDAPDLVYVDELPIRGRQAKMKVWASSTAGVERTEADEPVARGDGRDRSDGAERAPKPAEHTDA